MLNNEDLILEEGDERNQHLIQALRRVYHPSTEDAQSLARIRENLLTNSSVSPQIHYITRSEPVIPGISREFSYDTPSNPSKQRAWQHRLSNIAAVVFVTLLVGSLLIVLTHTRQNSTGTLRQPQTALQSLTMIDATSGWALTNKAILRTTDGGKSWKDVSPPHTSGWSSEAFLSASIAWIVVEQNDGYVHVFRTIDGGQSWQDRRLNYKNPTESSMELHISAINGQECWLYSVSTVFHTSDGGKSWNRLLTPQSTNSPLAYINWMAFQNSSDGWATGSGRIDKSGQLYATHDGGKTWQHQKLTLPSHTTLNDALITPPKFFNASDGVLPISFAVGNTAHNWSTDFYVTHNGGVTWNLISHLLSYTPGNIGFLDMNHWWVTDEKIAAHSDETVIHVTSDGGQQWTIVSPRSNYYHIYNLKFVSSSVGWALGNNTAPSQLGPAFGFTGSLLKTTDGGKSWSEVS